MKYLILILLTCILLQARDQSGSIIKSYPDKEVKSLEAGWEWAISEGQAQEESYWIGYSFNRMMAKNSFIGCYHDDESGSSLLENIKAGFQAEDKNLSDGYRHTSIGDSGGKVLKSIAVLFYMKEADIKEISVNNLTLPFDLKSLPLFWMGAVETEQSLDKLTNLFKNLNKEDTREDCIVAIGLHQHDKAFAFLKGVIHDEKNPDLRESAVFWLAESGFEGTYEELEWVIENDPSLDVREHAVFGFYLLRNDRGTEMLIKLARNGSEMAIRKKAIFWLGQVASKKALETLESTVFDEDETELQSQAVFALSQLGDSKGLPSLIKAAKNHPNPKIRKKAIFWLGQMDDDRALDVLEEIIEN